MTQELTTKNILSLFDTNKAQRASFAEGVIQSVNDGLINPLDLQVQLKCMADIISKIQDNPDYRDALQTEAAKYGRGRHEFHNCTFEVKATAGKYDYSHDAEWSRLKEHIKAREAFLKNLTEGMDFVTGEGEVVRVEPAKYTPGSDAVFITLK